MKYTVEDFMERLTTSERNLHSSHAAEASQEESRLEQLERENARLRNFVADLLMGRSA